MNITLKTLGEFIRNLQEKSNADFFTCQKAAFESSFNEDIALTIIQRQNHDT